MNIDEFDALKVDDKIVNSDGHVASVAVVSTGRDGRTQSIGINWGSGPMFWMHRQGTLWFSLEVVPTPPCPELCEEP